MKVCSPSVMLRFVVEVHSYGVVWLVIKGIYIVRIHKTHQKKLTSVGFFYLLYISMTVAYKLKGTTLAKNENWSNVLVVRLVERFVDWKHDKFIPMREVIQFIDKAVIYEEDFDSIMSKSEKKKSLTFFS